MGGHKPNSVKPHKRPNGYINKLKTTKWLETEAKKHTT
jgi:hypothetical protein